MANELSGKQKFSEAMDGITASGELRASTAGYVLKKASAMGVQAKKRFRAIAAACAVIALLVVAGGYYLYSSPVAAISIDVNPSVELEMNVFGRVISCRTFNDDGAAVKVNVKNMDYRDAVEAIIKDESFKKFMNADSYLVITVAADNSDAIVKSIESRPDIEALTASVETADKETVEEAHGCGFSFGKYKAYTILKGLDPSITDERAKSMTMREIRDRILALGGTIAGSDPRDNSEASCSSEGGNGYGKGENHGDGKGAGYGRDEGHGRGQGNKRN